MSDQKIKIIHEAISQAALYEQLAEECSELAQASLKKARKLREENFTPRTMQEIEENLVEEYTDVVLTAEVCNLSVNDSLKNKKLDRWLKRLENH